MLELNPQILQKYYLAIQLIRIVLCGEELCHGFADDSPNPYYDRTPYYIYVQIDDGYIHQLWTPFGKMIVLRGGWMSDLLDTTEDFLYKMNNRWIIEEVTNNVILCNYIESKDIEYCNKVKGYRNPYGDTKLYLIREIDDIAVADLVLNELKLYLSISTDYTRDKELFKQISQGTNTF